MRRRLWILLVSLLWLSGCSVLPERSVNEAQTVYLLQAGVQQPGQGDGVGKAVLLVTPPRAAPGFDQRQIVWSDRDHRLAHYRDSRWADTPARMLHAPLVDRLEASGHFAAVVSASGPGAQAGLRLDSEIVLLRHELATRPGLLRFAVRVTLSGTQGVVSRRFEVVEESVRGDAEAAVVAANVALVRLLEQITDFVVTAID